jgi:hypothetical protein
MFKPTSTIEFQATNGNTVRLSADAVAAVRVNARKGSHNQSVSVLTAADARAAAVWLASNVLDAATLRSLADAMGADATGGSNV